MQEDFPIEHSRRGRKCHGPRRPGFALAAASALVHQVSDCVVALRSKWAAGKEVVQGKIYPACLFRRNEFRLMANYELIQSSSDGDANAGLAEPVIRMADHPFRQSEL
jgi:hypothetical protein